MTTKQTIIKQSSNKQSSNKQSSNKQSSIYTLTLIQEPNQILNTTINNINYRLEFRQGFASMFCTIYKDDILLISSARVLPNQNIIFYDYLAVDGDFYIDSIDDIIDYNKFNVSQFLRFEALE